MVLKHCLHFFLIQVWEYIICGEKKILFGENKDA
jgi:hypothetical protein